MTTKTTVYIDPQTAMPAPPPTGSLRLSRKGLLAANPVGLVPIHWQTPLPRPEELLAEVHRLGFDGLQLGDQIEHEGTVPPDLLTRHRLRVAEIYAALPCSPTGPDADALDVGRSQLERLREMGGEMLVASLDGSPDRDEIAGRADSQRAPALTDAGWDQLAGLLTQLASEAAETGHQLSFHPHAGTYVETPAEVDRLLTETDDSRVGLCLDTGHCIVGGGDPVAVIDHYANRVTHVHLKDVFPTVLEALRTGRVAGFEKAVTARVFCPLGSGALDLASVLLALDRADYKGWLMVEQDSSWEPPTEASAISRRVLAWAQRHLGERH